MCATLMAEGRRQEAKYLWGALAGKGCSDAAPGAAGVWGPLDGRRMSVSHRWGTAYNTLRRRGQGGRGLIIQNTHTMYKGDIPS